MKTGLLWFDDDPKVPLATKVENAARRYREKFGKSPTVCYVHPKTLAAAKAMPTNVKLVESANIQPNHFWIGIN
jgi:hypothetical protein